MLKILLFTICAHQITQTALAATLLQIAEPIAQLQSYSSDTVATFSVGSTGSYIVTVTPYQSTGCTTAFSGTPVQNYLSIISSNGNYSIHGNSVAASLQLTGTGNAAMSPTDIGNIQSLRIRYALLTDSAANCVDVTCTSDLTCSPVSSAISLGTLNAAKMIFVSNSTHNANFGSDTTRATFCGSDSNQLANVADTLTYKGLMADSGTMGLGASTNYVNILGQDIVTTNLSSQFPYSSGISLTNSISTNPYVVWTGINLSSGFNTETSVFSCGASNGQRWNTSGGVLEVNRFPTVMGPLRGKSGIANSTTNTALDSTSPLCNATSHVYCVQQ